MYMESDIVAYHTCLTAVPVASTSTFTVYFIKLESLNWYVD